LLGARRRPLGRLHVVVVVDERPGGQHVLLDAALVGATQDAEVAALSPPRTPRVGCDLFREEKEVNVIQDSGR